MPVINPQRAIHRIPFWRGDAFRTAGSEVDSCKRTQLPTAVDLGTCTQSPDHFLGFFFKIFFVRLPVPGPISKIFLFCIFTIEIILLIILESVKKF